MPQIGPKLRAFGLLFLLTTTPLTASEWTSWRGPTQDGVATEKNLPASWSPSGENLLWKADWNGRSTPVVFDGRVCANGRRGEDILRQEAVACWDAATGQQLWERRFTVYHTAVPWNRVGWASLVADLETGYVYAQLVGGTVVALDKAGKTVWEWRAGEDFNRLSGYGGRTNTPILDEDQLIVHAISAAWGQNRGPGDRYVALDKKTGAIHWVSLRGEAMQDLNTYSTPVVAWIDGRRQIVGGGADGFLRGVDAGTGLEIWRYQLSQRGLNSSVIVADGVVFASHSEENIDSGVMGRVIALDVKGGKNVLPKEREIWRIEGLQAGFASPALWNGRLYLPDNSANLHAIDAKSGQELWTVEFGTVGKGSPVIADGKIYVTEVNGHIAIIEPGAESGKLVSKVKIDMPEGTEPPRHAEIYGSFAVGHGRLFVTTEAGFFCLGSDKNLKFAQRKGINQAGLAIPVSAPAPAGAAAAKLQLRPAVFVGTANDKIQLETWAFDELGRSLGSKKDATYTLKGIAGQISPAGQVSFDPAQIKGTVHAQIEAKVGELSAIADLRIAGPLPWSHDFEDMPVDKPPSNWLGAGKGITVKALEGEGKVLVQPKPEGGAPRATIYIGPSSMKGYTIQADVKGNRKNRLMTDVGLINNGYTLSLMGAQQAIQVENWESERRMMKQFPFTWEMGVWYTIKMRVDLDKTGKAFVRGKIWKRGETEPADWTVTVEDPLGIDSGSPGLNAFVPIDAFFDNVLVTANP